MTLGKRHLSGITAILTKVHRRRRRQRLLTRECGANDIVVDE